MCCPKIPIKISPASRPVTARSCGRVLTNTRLHTYSPWTQCAIRSSRTSARSGRTRGASRRHHAHSNNPNVLFRRFFFGKNKVMSIALGRSAEEEIKPSLHLLSRVCCMGTKKQVQKCDNHSLVSVHIDPRQVVRRVQPGRLCALRHHCVQHGRAGRRYKVHRPVCRRPRATGPLPEFPHSMEPQLRKLKLPVSLQKVRQRHAI